MATAMSEPRGRALVATILVGAAASTVLVAAAGADRGGTGALPKGWSRATIASGAATLAYPSTWKAIPGDKGTVSFAIRDRAGRYLGYLNVTPRQGAERLAGWAAFRTARNAADGDRHVRTRSAAEDVRFAGGARGSCVTDEYLSRVGANPYRELACIVSGRHATSVFVGAVLTPRWRTLGPIVERSAALLIER
jgi:hypothetical protein